MARSLKIAVVGAGVSGLATARELQCEGHQVTVYEKADQIGGTWLYTQETESDDPLGIDPNRKVVHSSSYASLRANLPWQLMGFPDYPFRIKTNGKLRNFPGRGEILQFLNEFAKEFGIDVLIQFNSKVLRVEQKDDDSWVVESRRIDDDQSSSEEVFAAVVVCNGHYSQPKSAAVPVTYIASLVASAAGDAIREPCSEGTPEENTDMQHRIRSERSIVAPGPSRRSVGQSDEGHLLGLEYSKRLLGPLEKIKGLKENIGELLHMVLFKDTEIATLNIASMKPRSSS